MEDKKTEQYTFAPEEKDILEILASFENELGEKLQESKGEIERVKYYEKFQMQGIDFNNIFITTEKDVDGNISYHIYCGDSSNEILSINEKGEIKIKPELEAFLGNIDLEKIMEENEKQPGRLKGISEKMEPEEMKKALKGKKENPEEEKENKEQEEPEEQMEEDLSKDLGEDLEIVNYRKIKDDNLDKEMKNSFKGAQEKGMAYSNKLNAFIVVAKIDGQYKMPDGFEPAKPTMKSVISINEDGSQVEKKVPHALIKTNNPKKEMSVTIGQYGYVDAGIVDRLPCNERVEMQLREQGEGIREERTKQLRDLKEKGGPEEIHELAHSFKKETQNDEEKSTSVDELQDEESIEEDEKQFSEDEEIQIETEAEKDKVSVDEFKRYMEQAGEGKTLEEKIEYAHSEIEQDYGAPNRTR